MATCGSRGDTNALGMFAKEKWHVYGHVPFLQPAAICRYEDLLTCPWLCNFVCSVGLFQGTGYRDVLLAACGMARAHKQNWFSILGFLALAFAVGTGKINVFFIVYFFLPRIVPTNIPGRSDNKFQPYANFNIHLAAGGSNRLRTRNIITVQPTILVRPKRPV